MKRFILSCILALLCIAASAALAIYIGYRPVKSTYPNGQVRISIPRRFFVPHGMVNVYHENGKLSYQYQMVNNIKNGDVLIYVGDQILKLHYVNEKLMGPVTFKSEFLDSKGIKPLFILKPKDEIELRLTGDKTNTLITGKRICSDDELLYAIERYSAQLKVENLETLLACFSLQNISLKNEMVECRAKGDYTHPQFKKDIQSVCSFERSIDTFDAKIKQLQIESFYDASNDVLKNKLYDKEKPENQFFTSYSGINKLVPSLIDSLWEKDSERTGEIMSAIFNNFTFSDTHLVMNNKKIWDISGDFNLIEGFSDPYYISSYTDGEMTSQFKITPEGVALKALYPLSKTPMLSLAFNINPIFRARYHSMVEDISIMLTKHFDDEDAQNQALIDTMSKYAMQFSDIFKSMDFSLLDNNGEMALGATLQLKNNTSKINILDDPMAAFDVILTTYQNGEPAHQAVGNLKTGYTIDGESADAEDILSMLNTASLNKVFDNIHYELEQKFGPIINNAKTPEDLVGIDPFFLGFYNGFTKAATQYKVSQLMREIIILAGDIQALYENYDNYNDLSAADLKQYGVITDDMLTDNKLLLNIFGGKIRILKSAAKQGDKDQTAFVLIYEGLPSSVCTELATTDWSVLNSGFIAVAASKEEIEDISKAYQDEEFYKRPSGTVYKPFDAWNACNKEKSSAVALKFR